MFFDVLQVFVLLGGTALVRWCKIMFGNLTHPTSASGRPPSLHVERGKASLR